MQRILFVDDEPRVLGGLRRMLLPIANEWAMEFVDSAAAALALLRDKSFDVVVSDLRMPGMDGATLLREVKRLDPKVVRIALSGHADRELALRAVQVTHRFLTKPCDATQLRSVVQRACRLQNTIHAPAIRELVGAVTSLPALPEVHRELTEALSDGEPSIEHVAQIIEKDPAIASKALQIVNSSLFGLARNVTDIRTAASLLGIDAIQHLAFTAGIFEELREGGLLTHEALVAHRTHIDLMTRVATSILPDRADRALCVTTCLLHDIGELIVPAETLSTLTNAVDATQAHAEIGGALLDLWGLPHSICEVVTYHHRPSRVRSAELDVLGAVHISDALAHATQHAETPEGVLDRADFDLEYLSDLEIEDRLLDWARRTLDSALITVDES
jgi:HD-like signal output (HDOD) protein/CheY-like chemotaxis protein